MKTRQNILLSGHRQQDALGSSGFAVSGTLQKSRLKSQSRKNIAARNAARTPERFGNQTPLAAQGGVLN
jgi:hypothetical protein